MGDNFLLTISCILMVILVVWFLLSVRGGEKYRKPVASLKKGEHGTWIVHVDGEIDGIEREIGHTVGVESYEHVGKYSWDIHLDHRVGKADAEYVVKAINISTTL